MSTNWQRFKRRWKRRSRAVAGWLMAHWLPVFGVAAYLAGVVWRGLWIFILHYPMRYIYSDMQFYYDTARRIRAAHYVLTPGDVTHPPGMSLLLAWGLGLDWPGGELAMLQFIISAAAPIAVAAVALLLLDRRAAWWALIVSSLYFPFIDYAGYLLAEGYIILLIPLVLAIFLLAMRVKRRQWAGVLGVVAGVLWCVGIAFKLVLLPGMVCFGAVYVLLYESPVPAARRWLVVAAVVVGLLPGMAWLSVRATRANAGRWCLVSNKDGADFLLGHYGRIRSIEWRDPTGQELFYFGSPSAVQHGYTESRVVHFRMTDSKSNWREAGAWIRANPGQAVVLSVEHVYDIFFTGVPWPTNSTPRGLTDYSSLAEAFHFVFVALLLIPSILLLVITTLRRGWWAVLCGPEFLILSPIFGVMAAVFMTTGELRYRIPWDAVFILLAIEFYRLVHGVMHPPISPPPTLEEPLSHNA